jgi:hypothetical protein
MTYILHTPHLLQLAILLVTATMNSKTSAEACWSLTANTILVLYHFVFLPFLVWTTSTMFMPFKTLQIKLVAWHRVSGELSSKIVVGIEST